MPLVFFNLGSENEITPFSEFEDGTLLMWMTENEKKAVSQPLSKNFKKRQFIWGWPLVDVFDRKLKIAKRSVGMKASCEILKIVSRK